jgi:hypothetical protein
MKTLIKKSTGEYVHVITYNQNYRGDFYTSNEEPQLYSQSATLKDIRMFHPKLDFTDIELIEVEVIRKDVIQNNDLLCRFLLWHNEKYPEKNISNSEIGKFNLELNK